MTVVLEIKSCEECPKRKAERYYTSDPFEHVMEWKCGAENGKRIAIMDWNDKPPAIPGWCPLRPSNA